MSIYYTYIYIYKYKSTPISICLPIFLSIYPFIHLSICLPVCLIFYLSFSAGAGDLRQKGSQFAVRRLEAMLRRLCNRTRREQKWMCLMIYDVLWCIYFHQCHKRNQAKYAKWVSKFNKFKRIATAAKDDTFGDKVAMCAKCQASG